jgi:gamma-glutamyl hercynylcysteine S-oxide synthase
VRNRARTRQLFDMIHPDAYATRPIALRNPIVFYEGHLPAFSAIAFLERGLGRGPVDRRLEELFARGIDPASADGAVPRSGASTVWPLRGEVLAFASAVDAAVLEALDEAALDDPRAVEGLHTALEHEAMHQETLLYMWRQVPYDLKVPSASSADVPPRIDTVVPPRINTDVAPRIDTVVSPRINTVQHGGAVEIDAGCATLGARRDGVAFGWDNEFDESVVEVPAFEIDVYDVTNGQYLEFVGAGGRAPAFWLERDGAWFWRGMFEERPLPLDWPVYVAKEDAEAYAAWRGRRLPTEAEYHRAAFGTPSGDERPFPWGADAPDESRGNFDFAGWEPTPVGTYPAGASAWGVHDLMGNGWEWTSTVFGPFPGFIAMRSYPEYSAEFFDGQHFVLKGASPATARELLRRSFRNWFRGNYPYPYASFRTVR